MNIATVNTEVNISAFSPLIISDTAVLGKTAGKDQQVEKSTYPALIGLEQARVYAQELHHQAMAALSSFNDQAQQLSQITQFLLARKS